MQNETDDIGSLAAAYRLGEEFKQTCHKMHFAGRDLLDHAGKAQLEAEWAEIEKQIDAGIAAARREIPNVRAAIQEALNHV